MPIASSRKKMSIGAFWYTVDKCQSNRNVALDILLFLNTQEGLTWTKASTSMHACSHASINSTNVKLSLSVCCMLY